MGLVCCLVVGLIIGVEVQPPSTREVDHVVGRVPDPTEALPVQSTGSGEVQATTPGGVHHPGRAGMVQRGTRGKVVGG